MRKKCQKRRRDRLDFVVLSVIVTATVSVAAAAATTNSFFDVNIKSQALSDLLNGNNLPNQTTSYRQIVQRTLDRVFRVDVSGHIQCSLLGPASDGHFADDAGDDGALTEPLFETKANKLLPRLLLGCHYDFARSNFGLTRIDATVQWHRPRTASSLIPSLIQLRKTERLIEPKGASNDCKIQWNYPNCSPATLKADLDLTRFSLSVPLHRRIDYELQVQFPAAADHRRQAVHNQTDAIACQQDWWLPDVSMKSSGQLESVNKATIRNPWAHGRGDFLDVRFMVRRQLQWSYFGLGGLYADDDPETTMALELQGAGLRQPSTSLRLRLNAIAERPVESLRLSIVHTIRNNFF
jgi:hypothetical protein